MASPKSPLARIVLFMVCLSIAGTIVSGVHYFMVDLPHQNAMQAPENRIEIGCYARCMNGYDPCMRDPGSACLDTYRACIKACPEE